MFKWIKTTFTKTPKSIEKNNDDKWEGFWIRTINGKMWKILPKRTKIAGKRPTEIAEHEMCYNIADDEFYVGVGDNRYKVYKCDHMLG